MIPIDVNEVKEFELYNLHGKEVLVTCLRVKSSSLPEGLYKYSIRHDDDGCGEAVTLEKRVIVNHHSDVISKYNFDNITITKDGKDYTIEKDGYIPIEDEDLEYVGYSSLNNYMKEDDEMKFEEMDDVPSPYFKEIVKQSEMDHYNRCEAYESM